MSFCKNCISGVTREGTSQGTIEDIGVKCYVGTPSGDKVILFLTHAFVLNLLLVVDFARNGFKHTAAHIRPPIDNVINALKETGVKRVAATEYCFLARYVVNIVQENIIQVAALSHPSQLEVPADTELNPRHLSSSTPAPSTIHFLQSITDKLLGASDETVGKEVSSVFAPGYSMDHWDGCTHGFAVRGDMTDPKIKAGKEGSFKSTAEWFIKYL